MDPMAKLKEVSGQLQEKFDEAGMGNVANFTGNMEGLLKAIEDGPDKALDNVQDMFKKMTGSIEEAIKDPSQLMPSSAGPLIACGSYYANAVVTKLMLFKDEITEMVDKMMSLAGNLKDPLLELAAGVKDAIASLEQALKALADLPQKIAEELTALDPSNIASLDTSSWMAALEVGDITKPIDIIMGSKAILKTAIDTMAAGAGDLQEFLTKAPLAVKAAFDLPTPLCFLNSMVMEAMPGAMKELLDLVEKLAKFSLEPIMKVFGGAIETLDNVDSEAITTPVKKFAGEAKELVEKMSSAVSAAKMAKGMSSPGGMPSPGGMGSPASVFSGLKGKFGK